MQGVPKSKKTKKALKAARKRKAEKAHKRLLTRPVNIQADLDAPETRWIVPLLGTENSTQRRHAEGTAFFIAPDILLTAWHNIPALIAKISKNSDVERDSYDWSETQVLSFMTISVLQTIGNDHALQRYVRHIHRFSASNDIAMLFLYRDETVPPTTPIEYAPLDADPPAIGERVRAFGYIDSLAHDGLTPDGILVLRQDPRIAAGNVEEIHEPRRDAVTLPFPCFAVNANFMGGMSGGPVSNLQGRVCGVVSRGLEAMNGMPPISYAACLWPILGDLVQWEGFNGGTPFTVMDLVRQNVPGQLQPYVSMANFHKYQVGIDEESGLPVEVRRRPE